MKSFYKDTVVGSVEYADTRQLNYPHGGVGRLTKCKPAEIKIITPDLKKETVQRLKEEIAHDININAGFVKAPQSKTVGVR